jgi:tetratricopeptide (TPR) repeat protein
MYQAFGTTNSADRVRLAKKALEASADCADAYVVLAEHAQSKKEALEYYEKGVTAGERALGPQTFREAAGHFWGVLETRPYMRALKGLALVLWSNGQHAEGVDHLKTMLRLNPNDNQGVRDILTSWFLLCDRNQELGELLEQYREETASWMFSKALLAFRQQGDTAETRECLKAAAKRNKFVPAFLLGQERLPEQQPEYYGLGDPNEAVIYAAANLSAWKSTPGAVTWVRSVLQQPKRQAKRKSAGSVRSDTAISKLVRLPLADEVWQAGFCELPTWLESGTESVMPWAVLILSVEHDQILVATVLADEPMTDSLWALLAETMKKPASGKSRRPTRICTAPDPRWELLQPHLAEIGITLQTADRLELLEEAFESLREHLTREKPAGLLEVPGVTPEIAASFHQTAARFYRQTPWRFLGDDNAIKIECDRYQSGPWYAVLMGQSGITLGVALYEDLRLLRKLWANELSEREHVRRTIVLAVTFGPRWETNPKDVLAARQLQWEIAGPEAYPTAYRKEPGMSLRTPLSWELELLEAAMFALPAFLAERTRDDPTPYRTTIAVTTGDSDLVLSWAVAE